MTSYDTGNPTLTKIFTPEKYEDAAAVNLEKEYNVHSSPEQMSFVLLKEDNKNISILTSFSHNNPMSQHC